MYEDGNTTDYHIGRADDISMSQCLAYSFGPQLHFAQSSLPYSNISTLTATGNGTVATVTFASDVICQLGRTVTIAGMSPAGYNGSWTVTASAAGSITFNCTQTGAQTQSGTVSGLYDNRYAAGNITNCAFNGHANVLITGGTLTFSGCYFTVGSNGNQALTIANHNRGSDLGTMQPLRASFSACRFTATANSGSAFISTNAYNLGATKSLIASFAACQFDAAVDMTMIDTTGTAGMSEVVLSGCAFDYPTNNSLLNPVINVGSYSRLSINGSTITDKGSGSGTFVNMGSDNYHSVVGNTIPGWTMSIPWPLINAVVANNSGNDSWVAYTPVATAQTGTSTFGTCTARYKQTGKTILLEANVPITSAGSGSGNVAISTPSNILSTATGGYVGSGIDIGSSGKTLAVKAAPGGGNIYVANYDNTTPIASGAQLVVSLTYEIN